MELYIVICWSDMSNGVRFFMANLDSLAKKSRVKLPANASDYTETWQMSVLVVPKCNPTAADHVLL